MTAYMKVWFAVFIAASCVLGDVPEAFSQGSLRERVRKRIVEKTQIQSQENNSLGTGDIEKSIIAGGITRTYIVHLPAGYSNEQSYPLVFVLHGGTGNARRAIRISQMSPKADREGFIVVYPNGTGKYKEKFLHWNDGSQRSGQQENNTDDTAFFRQLIDQLKKDYPIDSKRIYATGISNGAMMAYRLGCELSDQLAAIAPIAGALNYDKTTPSEPISVIIFHGTEDRFVPYEGGVGKAAKGTRTDASVAYAVNFWVNHNGCNPVPERDESDTVIIEKYSGGKAHTDVVLYTIKGGGHAWPGGGHNLLKNKDADAAQEISATDLMWEFFKNHPKE